MERPRISVVGAVYSAIIAFTALMLIASVPFGTYAVFYTQLSTTLSYQTHVAHIPFYVTILELNIPATPSFGDLFLGLTAIYVLFFVIAAVQGGTFGGALRSSVREGPGALLRNPLSALIMLLGSSLLATVALDYLQSSAGVGTGGLAETDSFLLLLDFTISPLIEEIGYRFFLIGVPLAILLLFARSSLKSAVKSLWRPSAAWDKDPDPNVERLRPPSATLKNFAWFLIALSSLVFGLAHFYSGAGWGPGKVTEAALDGVVLGYIYVRYGLHASVIYHWAVDYATNAFAFYGQGVYGIPWTANSNYTLIPTLDILVLVGFPGLLYFLNLLLKRVIRPRQEMSADGSSRQVNLN